MVEAIHLIYGGNTIDESVPDGSMLRQLFSKLFTGRGIEFFDAEPDEEFLSVFDGARNLPVEERTRVLQDFKRELMVEGEFFGEYGKMSEILIQSEDYLDNIKVPFLMFTLSNEEDIKDPSYVFRLDFFNIFYVADERFIVVLNMRNTIGNHLEIYLRFQRDEASRVVKAIIGTFEEYMGCNDTEAPCRSGKEVGMEEMYTHVIQRFNETQLKSTKDASETGLKLIGPNVPGRRCGA